MAFSSLALPITMVILRLLVCLAAGRALYSAVADWMVLFRLLSARALTA